MNEILALNNPQGVDMPLKNRLNPIHISSFSVIILVKSCCLHDFLLLSVDIRLYNPLLLEGSLDGIQCPFRTYVYRSLLLSQRWCAHVQKRTR